MKTIATRHSSLASALILFFMVAVTRAQIQTINIGSTSGGDTGDVGGTKINNNFAYVETQLGSNTASIASLTTNLAAVTAIATNTATNMVFTASVTTYTNAPALTLTGVTNLTAYYNMVIPAGAIGPAGTNIVTAYNLTNAWLSSFNNTVFATNNIVWGTSNFIGTFSTGFSSLNFNGGQLGQGAITPLLTIVNQSVFASTNGDVTWFLICTNGGASTFTTTNSVDLSVSGAGGGLGELEVYLIDHPELIGRTNGGYGQYYSAQDPVNPQDVATKNYTDTAIANSVGGSAFLSTKDTNGLQHCTLSVNGSAAIDVASSTIHLIRALGTIGTNILIYINVTNLTSGWTMQSTTNITQFYSWTAFTNWTSVTTNTVGGVSNTVTFTIPMTLPGQPMRFFDPQGQKSSSMTIRLPTTMTFLSLTNYTVTSSTNSTLGLPIHSLCSDGSYLYQTETTNLTSCPTNWARLAWPTNTW